MLARTAAERDRGDDSATKVRAHRYRFVDASLRMTGLAGPYCTDVQQARSSSFPSHDASITGVVPRTSRLLPIFAIIAAVALALVSVRNLRTPPTLHHAFGKGPTVVLVHGLGSRSEQWLPTARILARNYRVVLVELPGHGENSLAEPLSLVRAAQSLDAAIVAETSGPVLLVGHSVGGIVAAAEALAHPERVRGLVLVETTLEPQVEGAERDAMLHAVEHDYRALLRKASTSLARDPIQRRALHQEIVSLDSNTVKAWFRIALSADLSTQIRKLAPPLLAVFSERLWPSGLPWRDVERTLGFSEAPDLVPVRIEDSGHFIMLDQPERLAEVIERFAAHPEGEPVARK